MESNNSKRIKAIAVVLFLLCMAAALCVLIAELDNPSEALLGNETTTIIVIVSLLISGCVISSVLYGFGQLVGDMQQTRDACVATCIVINRISNLLESKAVVKNQQKDVAEEVEINHS